MLNLVKISVARENNPSKRGPKGVGRQVKVFINLRNMNIVNDQDIALIRKTVKADLCKALGIKDAKKQDNLKIVWNRSLSPTTPGFDVYMKDENKVWQTYRHNRNEKGTYTKDPRNVFVTAELEMQEEVTAP